MRKLSAVLTAGPLVNLYGPGSVFYWIRTKAKERKQRQQRANAVTGTSNPAFRFGNNPQQLSPVKTTTATTTTTIAPP